MIERPIWRLGRLAQNGIGGTTHIGNLDVISASATDENDARNRDEGQSAFDEGCNQK